MPTEELEKIFLITSKDEKDQVQKLGARWDGRVQRWYFLEKSKIPLFEKWIPKYLNVTYEERNQAKNLGAKWDGIAGKWYYLNPEDSAKFSKWLENNTKNPETAKSVNSMDNEDIHHITSILDRLNNGLKNVMNSDQYRTFLDVMAKVPSYSFRNTMLIYLQNHKASIVASPSRMSNDFGFRIKESELEKPIWMLKPNQYVEKASSVAERIASEKKGLTIDSYRLHYNEKTNTYTVYNQKTKKSESKTFKQLETFLKTNKLLPLHYSNPPFLPFKAYDISQAEPIMVRNAEGQLEQHPKARDTQLALQNHTVKDFENTDILLKLYEAAASTSDFPISYQSAKRNENGYFSLTKQKINITPTLTPTHAMKTLIHEMAHSALHNDTEITKSEEMIADAEVQAESVAYVVCQHYGLDTSDYSFHYIANYGKSIENIEKSFSIIQKTADKMIKGIDQKFKQLINIDIKKEGIFVQNPIFQTLLSPSASDISVDPPEAAVTADPVHNEAINAAKAPSGTDRILSLADTENGRYEGIFDGQPYSIQNNKITIHGVTDELKKYPEIKRFILDNINSYFQQQKEPTPAQEKSDQNDIPPVPEEHIYLKIPYNEKDTIKNLGAKWDNEKNQWYCLVSEKETFSRWIYPDLEEITQGNIIAGEIVPYGSNSYGIRILYPDGSTEVMSQTDIVGLENRINDFLEQRFWSDQYRPIFKVYEHTDFVNLEEKLKENTALPEAFIKQRELSVSYEDYEKIIPLVLENIEKDTKLYSYEEKKLYIRLAYEAQLQNQDITFLKKIAVYDALKGSTGYPSHYLKSIISQLDQEKHTPEVIPYKDSATKDKEEEKQQDLPENNIIVAIESTDDYADVSFHKELIDGNVQNKDGTYGRMQDFFRIVTINPEGKLEPFNKKTFLSMEEAIQYAADQPDLKIISYDEIVHTAGGKMFTASQSEQNKKNALIKMVDEYNGQLSEEELNLCRIYAETTTSEKDMKYCLEKTAKKQYGRQHDGSASPLLRATVAKALDVYLQETPDLPEDKRISLIAQKNSLEKQLEADNEPIPAKNITITLYQIKDSLIHEYGSKNYETLTNVDNQHIDIGNYARVVEIELDAIADIREIPEAIYQIANTYQEEINELAIKKYEIANTKQAVRPCEVGDIIKISADNQPDQYYYTDDIGFRSIDNVLLGISPDPECSNFLQDYHEDPVAAITKHFSNITKEKAKIIACLNQNLLPLPKSNEEMEFFKIHALSYANQILKNPVSVVIGYTESGCLMTGTVYPYNEADRRIKWEESAVAQMKECNIPIEYEKTWFTVIVQKENGEIASYQTQCNIGDGNQKDLSDLIQKQFQHDIDFRNNCISTGYIGARELTSEEIARYKTANQETEYLKKRLFPNAKALESSKKSETLKQTIIPFPENHKKHISQNLGAR